MPSNIDSILLVKDKAVRISIKFIFPKVCNSAFKNAKGINLEWKVLVR